ncbi:hypothetical protein OCOL_001759 [Ordospora colligata]|uniref:Glutaredoxin n=1 Tax=Ordospora colligata OC4 TaxID=1354746 RepID=A0A0B2UJ07_9MICR|nr:glutaredoxin [Ordospora colligata OC4]KHN69209.1 glutaredoxin [Ordospora colligata OC4]TBU14664.1 glutaredoxin [Ordospora colligata]
MYLLNLIVLASSVFMLEDSNSNIFYKDMINNSKCVMFVRKYCPYSNKARKMALENNIPCHAVIVDDNKNAEEFSKQFRYTFPNIFLDGESIGGSEEFSNREQIHIYPFGPKPFDPKPRHISTIDKTI